MFPQKIKINDKRDLYVKWEDSSESVISLMKLRRLCPCATCITEREKQSQSYIPILLGDQITISNIQTVGNYGLSITWKDGHSTGIYEFPFLKNLSELE